MAETVSSEPLALKDSMSSQNDSANLQNLTTISSPTSPLSEFNYILYGLVMSFILMFGLFGNVLTIVVLRQKDHRKKMIVPFIINLAAADLFIVVFGYPIAISSILSKNYITLEETRCKWSAFVNCSIGITSIATFTVISLQMCFSVTSRKTVTHRKLSNKMYFTIVTGLWSYGILTTCPPLFGWSRFVRGAAGISCGPDWASQKLADCAYGAFLVLTGFLLPLSIISVCYYKIISVLRLKDYSSRSNIQRQAWRQSQKQIVRMIGVSVGAFLLSWSPYCMMSIMSTVKGHYSLKPGVAEVPELMAKASVIYNPFVYTAMNARFRRSVKKIILGVLGC